MHFLKTDYKTSLTGFFRKDTLLKVKKLASVPPSIHMLHYCEKRHDEFNKIISPM